MIIAPLNKRKNESLLWQKGIKMTTHTKLFEIIGEEEYQMCLDLGRQIISCPICGNETFNDWFICPHCNWEAEPLKFEDEYSPANKSTVAEYRREYFRLQTNRLERIDKIMNRNISIFRRFR
jgi:hypothetical protein